MDHRTRVPSRPCSGRISVRIAAAMIVIALPLGLAACGTDVARHGGVRDDDPRSGHVGEDFHGRGTDDRPEYEATNRPN